MSSIKQFLISLRDPNGVAVRPSGFDCVRPCHSERSGAESNCEAAPSKAKVESRADFAQDDTQGATPSEKITKGVRVILFVLLFTRLDLQGIVCYTFEVYCRAVIRLPLHKGTFGLCVPKVCILFLTSTAFVDTKAKPRARRGEKLF